MEGVRFALLSAVLLILSFPRFNLGFLAWIALVPLFVVLRGKSLRSAFALSFVTGITFFMGMFYWILVVDAFTLTHFVLLGLYLASYVGLFGLALNFITERTRFPPSLTAPFIWVATEYLRSNAGFLGLQWTLLGHSQHQNLPLIQVASFAGVYGVSFLIAMVNTALSEVVLAWRSGPRPLPQHWWTVMRPAILSIFLVGSAVIHGFAVLSRRSDRATIAVSVIQGNIPQDMRWQPQLRELNLQKHLRLTRDAAAHRQASLIVWPETSVEGSLTEETYLRNVFSSLALESQSHLLIGVSVRPKFGPREVRIRNRFNSAFLISPSAGITGRYNKIHLLPFGEYLPHKDLIPWPSSLASQAGTMMAGDEFTLFSVNDLMFGVTICWESVFPNLFRQFVKNGATFTVNITNEAWFKKTAAPYQFMSMNVFRAIENRISIVRAANTGVSGFIDPSGEIIGKVSEGSRDVFVEGYLTMNIPVSRNRTFYTLYGDIFAYVNLVVTFVALAMSLLRIGRLPSGLAPQRKDEIVFAPPPQSTMR